MDRMKLQLLVVLAVFAGACGTVTAAATDAKNDAAGGAGAVGGEAAAGTSGHGGAGGELGGRGGGMGTAGTMGTGGAGHPSVAACPTNTAFWGMRCPTKYPDGTFCVLGCIVDNAGMTYDPPSGSCYTAHDYVYSLPAICLRAAATCGDCP